MTTSISIELHYDLAAWDLHPLLAAGLRRAQRHGRPVLVSAVRPLPPSDPLTFFARNSAKMRDRLFWASPTESLAMAGVGSAGTIEASGERRFAAADAAWRDYCADALIDAAPGVAGTGPVLIGGFAFDPQRPATPLWGAYPAGRLVLPRYLYTQVEDTYWLTINAIVHPDSTLDAEIQSLACELPALGHTNGVSSHSILPDQPLAVEDALPAQEWMAIVRSLVQQLQHGALEKIVLARECHVSGAQPFNPADVLKQLRADYPGCFHFAVARGDQCFLGASPERLVRLREGAVWATSLAGSIQRGASEDEDRRLGAALLASAKDREEHAIVVRALASALADLCVDLAVPDTPTLMKVRNVQHLFTPISGRVAGTRSILEFLERLHPTPAVGGTPHDVALRLIREREKMDRGWYAGPIGWLDARGEGEFAVAIRSALLDGATAALFAGCGIVADSDPASEYAESQLKLRPLLAALGRSIQ